MFLDGWMLTAGVHVGLDAGARDRCHNARLTPQRPLTVHPSPHPPHSLAEWRTNGSASDCTLPRTLVVPDDRLRRRILCVQSSNCQSSSFIILQHPLW